MTDFSPRPATPQEPEKTLSSEPAHDARQEDDGLAAARSALARAQRVAAAQGLRPGSRPLRRAVKPSSPVVARKRREGRDPQLLGNSMSRLLEDRGWNVDVAAGAVISRWDAIVGPGISTHAQPVSFEDGVLTVRAETTSWATQLSLLSSSLLRTIDEKVGEGVVHEIKVVPPAAPSWVRGPRRVAGRGPRDTYG